MIGDGVKRRGRPALPEQDRKSGNLTFRTRGDLRSQLEDSAKKSGRSVSEEIEYRLQSSFDLRSAAIHIFGRNNTDLIDSLWWLLSSPQAASRNASGPVNLAAITTILAYAELDMERLIERNCADPTIWLTLSETGISRACNLDADAAAKQAERVLPEMKSHLAEYRSGREMALRLKGRKAE